MVLKVIKGKREILLFGSKMTETELAGHIKFAEQIAAPLKEDIVLTLERLFEWEPLRQWDYVDFIYDAAAKKLRAVEKDENDEEAEETEEEEQHDPSIKII